MMFPQRELASRRLGLFPVADASVAVPDDGAMQHESDSWHLPAWAKRAGKKQADLARDLELTKNSAHKLWHGKQAMTHAQIGALAAWVGVRPYELFMKPADADALERLRNTAREIVGGTATS